MTVDRHRPLGAVPRRSPAAERLITAVAAQIEPRVEEIAARLIDRVVHEMDLPPDDDDLREDLLAAARGSVALITAMARSWTDPHVVPAPHDALVWARGLVARGLAIDALLRVYRIGQSGYHDVWHEALVASGEPPALLLEALNAVSAFTFTWIDTIAGPLVEAYEDERVRRLRGADAIRAETVHALLRGDELDLQVAESRLGQRLDRTHTALIAWLDPSAPAAALEALDGRLDAVLAVLAEPGTRPLIVRESPRVVLAWCASAVAPESRPALLAPSLAGGAVRVALGGPGRGVDGFRASHDEARRARRVARLLALEDAVPPYAGVAVLDLLTQDLEAARRVARATRGPLAGADAGTRRLLATLRVFLQERRSFARTARRLGVHENTVSYRVRRAEQLADTTDTDALWVAVQLAPLLDGAGRGPH